MKKVKRLEMKKVEQWEMKKVKRREVDLAMYRGKKFSKDVTVLYRSVVIYVGKGYLKVRF
jgi:hypothetical protein